MLFRLGDSPRSADQHPINVGDAEYNPLYPVGHGLSYPAKRLTQLGANLDDRNRSSTCPDRG